MQGDAYAPHSGGHFACADVNLISRSRHQAMSARILWLGPPGLKDDCSRPPMMCCSLDIVTNIMASYYDYYDRDGLALRL